VISLLSNAGVVLVLTRYLSQDSFGRYANVQSYSLILATLAMGGVFIILIREIARHPERIHTYLGTVLVLQFLLILTSFGIGLGLAHLIYSDRAILSGICVVLLSYVVLIPANLFSMIFVAQQRAVYMAASVLVERISYVIFLGLTLLRGATLFQILWAQVFSAATQLLFAFSITAYRFVPLPWKLEGGLGRNLFRAVFPISISEGLRVLDQQLNIILLTVFRSATAAGLLGAPQKLILRLSIIPDSLARGALPVFSQVDVQREGDFKRLGERLLYYMGSSGLLLTALIGPLGKNLAVLLFGTEYRGAGTTISLLSLAIAPLFAGYVLKYLLASLRKQSYELLALICALVTNFSFAALFIPRYGAPGAALAFLASQIVFCAVSFFALRRHIDVETVPMLKVSTIFVAVFLSVSFFSRTRIWILGTFMITIIAVGLLFFAKLFDLSDIHRYISIVNQKDST
jgi:O-antigen/teichoic acid export membrane protein